MFRFLLFYATLLGVLPGTYPGSSFFLRNDLATNRQNEPVVMSRQIFENHFGSGGPNEVPLLKKTGGEWIPSQTDDLNRDGRWDEIAFIVDIKSLSDLEIEAGWVPEEKAPVFEKKTQVYLARQNQDGSYTEVGHAEAPQGLAGFPSQYQSEGVGWENDKIAFRIYFDCRNSKDLFGKLIPDLILQKAGTPEWGSYHTLAPWGMDILHCGSSLGAGGLAMLEGDSLYRLGSTPGYQYVKITDGPVRAVFELRYPGWQVAGQVLDAVERVTLWTGKYWFQSEVTVSGFSGEKELVTGIVTSRLNTEPVHFKANSSYSALLTHGKQSLNNDILAMAVMAPSREITKMDRTSNTDYYKLGYQTVPEKSFSQVVSETCYVSQTIKNDTPSTHYFFALWGLENPKWNNRDMVQEYIRLEAEKTASPLKIEFNR